jgi:hypothetical protein
MEGGEWIALATAAALIGTGDAPRRIQRALMLGTVRARGVIPQAVRSDIPPEGLLVEIPASEFASLGIDCARSRALPGERERWRVTVYAAVEVRRPDIEALAREDEKAAARAPGQGGTASDRQEASALVSALAAKLREMFPGGPPALRNEELARQVRAAPGVRLGVFSLRTLVRARSLAWPQLKRQRRD